MRGFRRVISLFLFVILFTSVASAQVAIGITDEDRAEFARRRAALMEKLGDDTAVFFSAPEREDYLRYRQDNTFYYFTGVEIPWAVLVLDGKTNAETLYLPSGYDSRIIGKRIGPGPEAVKEFGIKEIKYTVSFEYILPGLVQNGGRIGMMLKWEAPVAGGRDAYVWSEDGLCPDWEKRDSRVRTIKTWIESMLPGRTVFDVSPIVDELRRIKSDWEIERMTEACRIAGEGHVAAMKATKPGVYEWEIEAAATEAFVQNGALYPSYGAIVGAGKNSAILHYPHSASVVKKRDLVLMDYGPDYRYYSADITRTWPAKGKFNKKFRKIYEDCLEIQQKIIEYIKPGVTLKDLSDYNRELMQEMGYEDEYWHGPSHLIGMSAHDVGDYTAPLKPGCTITVEPGIYSKNKWGVRIEDVVVVTKKGRRVLSDMIPKDPDEIEAIMAQN